jgi:hypothetical protein
VNIERNTKCLKLFVEMKIYFVCMSLNGLKGSERDMRTLNVIKDWAVINCSKFRSSFKSFINWWPETIK